jgi:quercetin dioxygenase-like cupin family protein
MNSSAQMYKWDDMALEKVTDAISRKYVAGDREMVAQVYLKRGAIVPTHSHESEQFTYVLTGALKFALDGREFIIRAGELLRIPSHMPHSAEALEDTFELDLFSPIRLDWIDGTDHYFGRARQRRERKPHFGELVQLDGSQHPWLEERGPSGCAMTLVDDATHRVLLQFAPQETTWAAADVLRAWIETYGVPQALYTDWKNVYVRRPTEAERLAAIAPLTQFGRMCAALDIQIIPASSPQAKGRSERQHGTQQDRLIKKRRRAGITTYDEANQFVAAGYLPEHNARFARAAASPEDFHRPRPSRPRLDQAFVVRETRALSNDWVVRYRNRLLQLERPSRRMPARSTVHVCEARDGTMTIRYRDRVLPWREILPGQPPVPVLPPASVTPVPPPVRGPRAGADHPWRRRIIQWRSPSGDAWPLIGD